MRIGLYPGCSLTGSSREYKESVVVVAKALGIILEEVPDWNCCGATAAHNLNHELALALPTRILALAEQAGFDKLVIPCAACYSRLTITQDELNNNPELKAKIIAHLGMDFKGTMVIQNAIQFIQDDILPILPAKITKPFDYKVACYYGCLLVRPHGILKFDRPEDPQTMDAVISAIGGTPIEWAFKNECCGAAMSIARTDVVGKLSGNIVKDAVDRGAEAIIVACPMCHSNLDMRRPNINKAMGEKFEQPVIYITQAIGLAIGLSPKELGLQRHFVAVNLPEKKVVETIMEEK